MMFFPAVVKKLLVTGLPKAMRFVSKAEISGIGNVGYLVLHED
jgi:hypothetical protein